VIIKQIYKDFNYSAGLQNFLYNVVYCIAMLSKVAAAVCYVLLYKSQHVA